MSFASCLTECATVAPCVASAVSVCVSKCRRSVRIADLLFSIAKRQKLQADLQRTPRDRPRPRKNMEEPCLPRPTRSPSPDSRSVASSQPWLFRFEVRSLRCHKTSALDYLARRSSPRPGSPSSALGCEWELCDAQLRD